MDTEEEQTVINQFLSTVELWFLFIFDFAPKPPA